MSESTQLWCRGSPSIGERTLDEDERARLISRVGGYRRTRTRTNAAWWAGGGVGVIAAIAFVVWKRADQDLTVTILVACLVGFGALGLAGSLCAVIWPEPGWLRWLFGAALLVPPSIAFVFEALAPDEPIPAPSVGWAILVVGGFVAVVGGFVSWCRYASAWRALRSNFAAIDADLADAVVVRFAGPDLEILPHSQLLYSYGAEPIDHWEPVDIDRVASPPDDLDMWEPERDLCTAELEELAGSRRRLPRRLLVQAVETTLIVAALAQLVEFMLGEIVPELSVASWLVVAVVVVARSWPGVAMMRGLDRDRRVGRVVRVWSQTGIRDAPDVEVLSASGLVWREHGEPARWRTRP